MQQKEITVPKAKESQALAWQYYPLTSENPFEFLSLLIKTTTTKTEPDSNLGPDVFLYKHEQVNTCLTACSIFETMLCIQGGKDIFFPSESSS